MYKRQFEHAAASVVHAPPRIPVVGNLDGRTVEAFGAPYWSAHARGTVRFAEGIATLGTLGCDLLVEVGPQPVLLAMAREIDPSVSGVGLLRRGAGAWPRLLEAVGWLWTRGVEPDWDAVEGGRRHRRVSLPRSPFRRQRYWLEERSGPPEPTVAAPASAVDSEPPAAVASPVGSPVVSGFYDDLTVIAADGSGEDALAASHLTLSLIHI